jgi:hypothetical protein
LVVTLLHGHVLAILCGHDLLAEGIDGEIFLSELAALPSVEVALLGRSEVRVVLFLELLLANILVLLFQHLVHSALTWDGMSWIPATANSLRSCPKLVSHQLTVNAGLSVVEDLICNDWVFKIMVTLWNMFPRNSSAHALEILHGAFLLPVGNEGAVLLVVSVLVKCGVHVSSFAFLLLG